MRHTAATLALERGESIKAVAAMLGDTEVTVMRVYAHATPLMQESLTATMDSLLDVSEPVSHEAAWRDRAFSGT
jgi:site-specific recombinase XerD